MSALSPTDFPSHRRWRGTALMVIAAIHTLVGLVEFQPVVVTLLDQGLFNTVGHDPLRGAVAWFLLFGVLLFVTGAAVREVEKREPGCRCPWVGISLLALVALGVTLMPASGFWLAIPPAVSLLRPTRKA